MTISETTSAYNGNKVLVDKLVCQYVDDNGARVLFRFVVGKGKLYIRKDRIKGFGDMTTQDTQLSEEDVTDELLAYIAEFLDSTERTYDIYKRNDFLPADAVLGEDIISSLGLQGKDFAIF